MPRCGERCSYALRSISHTAFGGGRLLLTFTCCGDSTDVWPWLRAWIPANHVPGRQINTATRTFGILQNDGPRRATRPRERRTPRTTRDSGHRAAAPVAGPAPWEGPLVSETIDLFSGSSGEPEESPGPSRSAGQPAGVAPAAGTSPAQTGAVRSRPGADDGTSAATQPAAGKRAGTGLNGMLMPELQRLAQSLGLTGTTRLRKGDLVAAIQERQSGRSGATGPVSAAR